MIFFFSGGAELDVGAGNRQEFVDLYVDYLFNHSIAVQFDEFKSGFQAVAGGAFFLDIHNCSLDAQCA